MAAASHGASVAPSCRFGDGSASASAHLSDNFETLDVGFSAILEVPSSHALHFDISSYGTLVPGYLESVHADALACLLAREQNRRRIPVIQRPSRIVIWIQRRKVRMLSVVAELAFAIRGRYHVPRWIMIMVARIENVS